MPSGRPPEWPKPWMDLAAASGGSRHLREQLGYASKTTLSAKIAGRSPWTRGDWMVVQHLAVQYDQPFLPLFAPRVHDTFKQSHGVSTCLCAAPRDKKK